MNLIECQQLSCSNAFIQSLILCLFFLIDLLLRVSFQQSGRSTSSSQFLSLDLIDTVKCVKNYRGVSIQSSIPKLMNFMFARCRFGSVVVSQQYVLTMGRSTATNFLLFQQYIVQGMERSLQCDAIYMLICLGHLIGYHMICCCKN